MPASSKFVGVDFFQIEVEKLTPDLDIPGQGFRCARGELPPSVPYRTMYFDLKPLIELLQGSFSPCPS